MKGTKYRILRAARLLFNERGMTNVTQRTIADHIAISPGNLTYHFKKREEIVETLYLEMREEISAFLTQFESKSPSLDSLFDLSKGMNKLLYENRFFTSDYFEIIRSNEFIKKDYVSLSVRREELVLSLLSSFTQQGLMRKEELPQEFNYLSKRIQLLTDYWIIALGTSQEELMLKHTRVYTEMGMQMLYPYLTVKGKEAFKNLMNY